MPTWAWVLTIIFGSLGGLLGLLAVVLALFRIRYFIEWRGAWDGGLSGSSTGTAVIETGFPGFKRTWEPLKDASWTLSDLVLGDENEQEENQGNEADKASASQGPEEFREEARPGAEEPVFLKTSADPDASEPPSPITPSRPDSVKTSAKKKKDPNRMRRTLFRLVTDRDAWKLLGRYGVKISRLVLKLLKPRIEAAVGHPDPAFLGRVAGKWYAIRPLVPALGHDKGRVDLYFRFQDRHPSLWIRVEGRLSALSVVWFGLRLLIAFPSIRLARRAIHSWRRHRLTGWRAWVYRKLQPAHPRPH